MTSLTIKKYINKVAADRVRKDTLRNFGALTLVEILLVILLVNLGVLNPGVLHLCFSFLVNLIPSYFFSKYKDRSRENKVLAEMKAS